MSRFNDLEVFDNTAAESVNSSAPTATAVQHKPKLSLMPEESVVADSFTGTGEIGFGIKSGAKQAADGTWKNALGLESTAEHRHVAKAWQQKCKKFDDVAHRVRLGISSKRDIFQGREVTRVGFDPGRKVFFDHRSGMAYTDTGLESLLEKTGVPKTMLKYMTQTGLSKNPVYGADLARFINNELEEKATRGNFLLRARKDQESGSEVCRFVATEAYTTFDNHQLLDLVGGILGNTSEVLVSSAEIDGDSLFAHLLLPDSLKSCPDSDYGVGVALRNSEVGQWAVEVSPFLFRAICWNGNIWGRRNSKQTAKRKHRGEGMIDTFADLVKFALENALTHGYAMLDRTQKLHEVSVKDAEGTIAILAKDHRLTGPQASSWLYGYETEAKATGGTAFSLLQGLTRGAQDFEGQTRFEMESLSGSLLAPDGKIESLDYNALSNYWHRAAEKGAEATEEQRKLVRVLA